MMRIKIVNSESNKEDQEDDEYNLHRGTKFLKELVIPWANMDRIVCLYSYFSSVPAAE